MYECLFENTDFLVINKFQGISFNNEQNASGLFSKLREDFGDLYAVHRLDKVTSGLLLIAKNKKSASELGLLFSSRNIEKYYIALSDKKPKKKQGLIKGDMMRSRNSTWKLLPTITNPARTSFFSFSIEENLRLFILKPLTGKTHQLRVGLKSIGAPILGDTLYNGTLSDRVYLHAYRLIFNFKEEAFDFSVYPNSGEIIQKKEIESKIKEINFTELKWPIKK